MPKFIHAADIHLDSPLLKLEYYDGAPVDAIRNATRKALENLVNLAIAESVDFMLIAGDLYDSDWKDYNTGLFFVSQMARLREHGVRVLIIAGNHDAGSR
ncbi:MAG: DNA repair exonuclease, partial [Desulfatirhabdiaceae bacterium]